MGCWREREIWNSGHFAACWQPVRVARTLGGADSLAGEGAARATEASASLGCKVRGEYVYLGQQYYFGDADRQEIRALG